MATPLTFGNLLKFGPDSFHKSKVDLPSSLCERAPEAPCEHTPPPLPRGALQRGLARMGVVTTEGGRTRARDDGGGFSASAPIQVGRRH